MLKAGLPPAVTALPRSNPTRRPCLDRLLHHAEGLSRAAVWAGGALTLASVALITADVIARKLLGRGIGGADELASYVFAISTSWAFAFTVLQRAHVRVDVFYHLLPVRAAAAVDWLCLVAFAVFFGCLSFFALDVAMASWAQGARANTTLGTPLWIPQALWFAGLAWMCVVVAMLLLRATVALVHGDLDTIQRLAGVRSAQEEARTEAESGRGIIEGERS